MSLHQQQVIIDFFISALVTNGPRLAMHVYIGSLLLLPIIIQGYSQSIGFFRNNLKRVQRHAALGDCRKAALRISPVWVGSIRHVPLEKGLKALNVNGSLGLLRWHALLTGLYARFLAALQTQLR